MTEESVATDGVLIREVMPAPLVPANVTSATGLTDQTVEVIGRFAPVIVKLIDVPELIEPLDADKFAVNGVAVQVQPGNAPRVCSAGQGAVLQIKYPHAAPARCWFAGVGEQQAVPTISFGAVHTLCSTVADALPRAFMLLALAPVVEFDITRLVTQFVLVSAVPPVWLGESLRPLAHPTISTSTFLSAAFLVPEPHHHRDSVPAIKPGCLTTIVGGAAKPISVI